jgi:hypothetical protein
MHSLSILLISLPFSGVGLYYDDIFFSISIVFYIIFMLFSFKYINLNKVHPVSLSLIIFVLLCFFSNIFKNSLSSFILPLLMLIFLISPFFFGIHRQTCSEKFYKTLKLSYHLLIGTILFEVLLYLIYGLNPGIYLYLGIQGSSIEFYGIPRLRGFQLEPSILSYLALFYLVCFNVLSNIFKINPIYRFSPILVIFATLSSSGVLFLLVVIVLSLFNNNKTYFNRGTFMILSSVVLLMTAVSPELEKAFYKILSRIFEIYFTIQEGVLSGSVGYRVHSILETIDFFSNAEFINIITGTGFSNYKSYIYEKYNHLHFSGFLTGDLNSILSVVAISTGLFGLLSFVSVIFFGVRSCKTPVTNDFPFIFIIFLLFSYGNMLAPFFWVILFSFFCLRQSLLNDRIINSYN